MRTLKLRHAVTFRVSLCRNSYSDFKFKEVLNTSMWITFNFNIPKFLNNLLGIILRKIY